MFSVPAIGLSTPSGEPLVASSAAAVIAVASVPDAGASACVVPAVYPSPKEDSDVPLAKLLSTSAPPCDVPTHGSDVVCPREMRLRKSLTW